MNSRSTKDNLDRIIEELNNAGIPTKLVQGIAAGHELIPYRMFQDIEESLLASARTLAEGLQANLYAKAGFELNVTTPYAEGKAPDPSQGETESDMPKPTIKFARMKIIGSAWKEEGTDHLIQSLSITVNDHQVYNEVGHRP
jgi:hypothetical protein